MKKIINLILNIFKTKQYTINIDVGPFEVVTDPKEMCAPNKMVIIKRINKLPKNIVTPFIRVKNKELNEYITVNPEKSRYDGYVTWSFIMPKSDIVIYPMAKRRGLI